MPQEPPPSPQESSPEELQQRIQAYRRRHDPQPGFGRAMALVMTLGVTLAAVMYGSYVLGDALQRHTGRAWCLPVTLLVGAAAAGWVGYLLIRPLLHEDS